MAPGVSCPALHPAGRSLLRFSRRRHSLPVQARCARWTPGWAKACASTGATVLHRRWTPLRRGRPGAAREGRLAAITRPSPDRNPTPKLDTRDSVPKAWSSGEHNGCNGAAVALIHVSTCADLPTCHSRFPILGPVHTPAPGGSATSQHNRPPDHFLAAGLVRSVCQLH